MEISTLPRLHTLSTVCERTGLSRSALYREFSNPRGLDGEIRNNPAGRLKVVYVGRAIRVTESDLCRFIESLGE